MNSSVFIQDEDEFYPRWATKRRSPRPLYINQHSGGYNLDDWNTQVGENELSTHETFCIIRDQVYQTLNDLQCSKEQTIKSILKYKYADFRSFRSEQLSEVVRIASKLYKPKANRSVCFNAQVKTVEFPFMEDIYWGEMSE